MNAGPVVVDSVTALPPSVRGAVLVTGSHGGMIAAHYALAGGVRAVVFNDAGRGLGDAGVAGVIALDAAGCAAAAVAHTSARIGDGADTLARGIVSYANRCATALGVAAGQRCRDAAARLRTAAMPVADLLPARQTRCVFAPPGPRRRAIAGLDSIGLIDAADAGIVLVIGSHGALHGGVASSALLVDAHGAFFHDACGGCDGAGYTRLPALDRRGIAAASVDGRTARIGEARSLWETGVISRVNGVAARTGVAAGMRVDEAAVRLASG